MRASSSIAVLNKLASARLVIMSSFGKLPDADDDNQILLLLLFDIFALALIKCDQMLGSILFAEHVETRYVVIE